MKKIIFYVLLFAGLCFSCSDSYYIALIHEGEHIAPGELTRNTTIIIEMQSPLNVDTMKKGDMNYIQLHDALVRKVTRKNLISVNYVFLEKNQIERYDVDKYRFILKQENSRNITYFSGEKGQHTANYYTYYMLDRKTGTVYENYEFHETDKLRFLGVYLKKLDQVG